MNLEDLANFASVSDATISSPSTRPIDPKWLKKFRNKVDAVGDGFCLVFVFSGGGNESIVQLEKDKQLKAEPMPYHMPDAEPGLFIVTQNTGGQGWVQDFTTTGEAVTFLESDSHLRRCPTLVSSGGSDTVHFFPEGTVNRDQGVAIGVGSTASLTVTDLKNSLEFFATDKILNHPSNRGVLWEDSDKYYPTERAEKAVQRILVLALQMAFRNSTVLDELKVPSGRTDVVLEERVSATFTRYLLELKVVRSFTHTGSTLGETSQLKHCKDGIIQARVNGEDLTVDSAFLCAYDFRKNPSTSLKVAVEAAADPHQISVSWHPVFNTSESDREHRAVEVSTD